MSDGDYDSKAEDTSGTVNFPPGRPINKTPLSRFNGTSKSIFRAHGLPGDPMATQPKTLADDVATLEKNNAMYQDEFGKIREYIFCAQAILGIQRPPDGTLMKLSSALQEIVVELDKRADVFGNIDPEIAL